MTARDVDLDEDAALMVALVQSLEALAANYGVPPHVIVAAGLICAARHVKGTDGPTRREFLAGAGDAYDHHAGRGAGLRRKGRP